MPFDAPNYTQFPNALIMLMPEMGEAELKVTLAIARKTFGWHKDEDKLSLSQLMELTGLSRQGVLNGILAGTERGTIARREDGDSFKYRLLVNEVDQTSQPSRPEVVNEVDTQKKDKEKKETAAVAMEENQPTQDTPNIFKLYENLGLSLNPTIAEQLIEAETQYPPGWIKEAFSRAAAANVRRWNYIEGILKQWLAAGAMDYPARFEKVAHMPAPVAPMNPKWVQT